MQYSDYIISDNEHITKHIEGVNKEVHFCPVAVNSREG